MQLFLPNKMQIKYSDLIVSLLTHQTELNILATKVKIYNSEYARYKYTFKFNGINQCVIKVDTDSELDIIKKDHWVVSIDLSAIKEENIKIEGLKNGN